MWRYFILFNSSVERTWYVVYFIMLPTLSIAIHPSTPSLICGKSTTWSYNLCCASIVTYRLQPHIKLKTEESRWYENYLVTVMWHNLDMCTIVLLITWSRPHLGAVPDHFKLLDSRLASQLTSTLTFCHVYFCHLLPIPLSDSGGLG